MKAIVDGIAIQKNETMLTSPSLQHKVRSDSVNNDNMTIINIYNSLISVLDVSVVSDSYGKYGKYNSTSVIFTPDTMLTESEMYLSLEASSV